MCDHIHVRFVCSRVDAADVLHRDLYNRHFEPFNKFIFALTAGHPKPTIRIYAGRWKGKKLIVPLRMRERIIQRVYRTETDT